MLFNFENTAIAFMDFCCRTTREYPEMIEQLGQLAPQRARNPLYFIDFIWFNCTGYGRKMKEICEKLDQRAREVYKVVIFL